MAGLATGICTLLIFVVRKVLERLLDASLGFAAGVMLETARFSMTLPAIKEGGIWKTAIGLLML